MEIIDGDLHRDESRLRKEAEQRVGFKNHLAAFVVVIVFIWIVWALTGTKYAWPIWPTAGWGVGIAFHYLATYHPFNLFSVEKEVERLRKREP